MPPPEPTTGEAIVLSRPAARVPSSPLAPWRGGPKPRRGLALSSELSAICEVANVTIRASVSADRPVVRIWSPDDAKRYVELQFESQQAANTAVEQLNSMLKYVTEIEFGEE